MRFGNASTTVTGTVTPASVNTRVMPHLRPTRPMVIVSPHTAGSHRLPHSLRSVGGLGKGPQLPVGSWRLRPRAPTSKMDAGVYVRDGPRASFSPSIQLDLHVDPGRQFQLHQGVHGLVRGVQYVHQALVRANFELIARILVAMRRSQDREALHFDGQRHGTFDGRAGAFRGIDGFAARLVDQTVIERLQPNPNVLIGHKIRSRAPGAAIVQSLLTHWALRAESTGPKRPRITMRFARLPTGSKRPRQFKGAECYAKNPAIAIKQ